MDFEEFKEIYAENIKSLRAKAKIRQDTLAEKIGLSEKYISGLETGRRVGSLETLFSLANALGAEPYELLLPPRAGVSYDAKRTQELMRRVRANVGDLLDTLDDYLKSGS